MHRHAQEGAEGRGSQPRSSPHCLDVQSTRAGQRVTLPPPSAAIDELDRITIRSGSQDPTPRFRRQTSAAICATQCGTTLHGTASVAGATGASESTQLQSEWLHTRYGSSCWPSPQARRQTIAHFDKPIHHLSDEEELRLRGTLWTTVWECVVSGGCLSRALCLPAFVPAVGLCVTPRNSMPHGDARSTQAAALGALAPHRVVVDEMSLIPSHRHSHKPTRALRS